MVRGVAGVDEVNANQGSARCSSSGSPARDWRLLRRVAGLTGGRSASRPTSPLPSAAVICRMIVLGGTLLLAAADVQAFGLDDVAARAAKLASTPYQKPSP